MENMENIQTAEPRGRQPNGTGQGIGGVCKCMSCGYAMDHTTGKPCNETKCPQCGALMIRV